MKKQGESPNHQAPTSRRILNLEVEGKTRRLELIPDSRKDTWLVELDGVSLEVSARLLQPGILSLIVNGRVYRCWLDEGPVETAVDVDGIRVATAVDDPRSMTARRQRRSAASGQQVIKAPMPGRIVRVIVAPGQAVLANQPVIAIEAMKMQNELKAPRPGTVREVRVEAGQTVVAGETLLVID
jgi:biotin carboxyl carrier protein